MSGLGAADTATRELLVDILLKHLPNAPPDAEWSVVRLPDIGLDSMTAIELVIGIEESFGVQFSDELLVRETFESVPRLEVAIRSMLGGENAPHRPAIRSDLPNGQRLNSNEPPQTNI